MAFVRINGVLLHYRLRGREGAPVVALANSLGTDMRIWDELIDLLSDGYRSLKVQRLFLPRFDRFCRLLQTLTRLRRRVERL